MLKWLKKTALWIVAVPLLTYYLGAGLNQAVLVANHDRFPVMWNSYKALKYEFEIVKAAEETCGDGENANPEICADAQFDLKALQYAGYLDDTHVLMSSKTHLNFLADWIDLKSATYSPGDVLLMLGNLGMEYAPWIWAAVALGKLSRKEE